MPSWPALLVAPLVVLAQQSIAYALVSPACALQDRSVLHAVSAVSLLLVLGMTALAWRAWRGARSSAASDAMATGAAEMRPVTAADGAGASQRPHFIDLMAVVVGALSALVCVVVWVPVWLLSPCY